MLTHWPTVEGKASISLKLQSSSSRAVSLMQREKQQEEEDKARFKHLILKIWNGSMPSDGVTEQDEDCEMSKDSFSSLQKVFTAVS